MTLMQALRSLEERLARDSEEEGKEIPLLDEGEEIDPREVT